MPPGPAPDHFGIHLAADGDRALVGMMTGADVAIWSYRRDGAGWVPEAPLPAAALPSTDPARFAFEALELSGDKAVVGTTATVLVFDGTSWQITEQLPGVRLRDVDMVAGVGVGTGPLPSGHEGIVVVERGPSGWAVAETFSIGSLGLFSVSDMAIEGGVAAVGDANWWHCSHFAWDGQFAILERDGATGAWSHTQQVQLTDCRESLLAGSLEVSDGSIFATREQPNRIEVYGRGAGGVWSRTGEIELAGHRLLLPSPGGSFEGEVGSEARPVIRGDVAFVPFVEGVPGQPTGAARVGRFERDPLLGIWELAAVHDTPAVSTCLLPGTFASGHGTIAALPIAGAPEGPVGALVPERGPGGCFVGVSAYEPVVSSPTCAAIPTSTGVSAGLDLVGSFRRADDRTTFVASGMPASVFTLPLFSQTPGFTAHPGGSAGNLCIGEPITRLLPFAGPADGAGTFQFQVDVVDGLGGATVEPGTATFFQLWFRDVDGAGQPTSNFTNGAVMRSW